MRVYFYYITQNAKSQAIAQSGTMDSMKILQMNVWTGRIKGAIERFLKENDFDVICMQEAVWSGDIPELLDYYCTSVEQIKEASGLQYDFRSSAYYLEAMGGRIEQGIVILSRSSIVESESKHILGEYKRINDVYNSNNHNYCAQKVALENGFVVVNYHGYWQSNPIGNETTVECMRKVADMIRDEDRPTVMCGDLNVVAESPAMRELDFMRNLTAENNIKQTLQNLKFVKDVACDHILINEKVSAKNYQVHDQLVSDHKAVSAEIEII